MNIKEFAQKIYSSNVGVFLIIAVLTFICYSFVLDAPFKTMDDYISIVDNPYIKDFKYLPEVITDSFFQKNTYWRPLVLLSFMFEYKVFGLNASFYYLNNILLHIVSAFGVFLLLKKLTDCRIVGFFTALLFAIHPIQWEQISNVPGRSILLCGLFFIYSFYAFIRMIEEEKFQFMLASLLFYGLALMSKEAAVMLPFCVIAYLKFGVSDDKKGGSFRIDAKYYRNCFFIFTVLYFIVRDYLDISQGFRWISLKHTALSILTFIQAVFVYVKLIILPTGLYYDRSYSIFPGFFTPQVISLILMLLIGFYFIRAKKLTLSNIQKFFVCWIVINLAIVSQIVPVLIDNNSISAAEHFLYIPSVGIFALIVLWLRKLLSCMIDHKVLKQGMVVFCCSGLIVFYVLITINQVIIASNQITMFKQSIDSNPRNVRVLTPLALAYAYSGNYAQAEKYYKMSLRVAPGNVRGLIGAGRALCDQGKYWEGLRYFNKVDEPGEFRDLLEKNKYQAHLAMEKKYKDILNKERKVIKRTNEKIRIAQLHYYLGTVYTLLEKYDEAELEYRRALTIRPKFANALINLASNYEENAKLNEALKIYNQILSTIVLSEERLKYVTDNMDRILRNRAMEEQQ